VTNSGNHDQGTREEATHVPTAELVKLSPTRTVRTVDAGRGEVLCGCVPATAAFVPVSSSPSPDRWTLRCRLGHRSRATDSRGCAITRAGVGNRRHFPKSVETASLRAAQSRPAIVCTVASRTGSLIDQVSFLGFVRRQIGPVESRHATPSLACLLKRDTSRNRGQPRKWTTTAPRVGALLDVASNAKMPTRRRDRTAPGAIRGHRARSRPAAERATCRRRWLRRRFRKSSAGVPVKGPSTPSSPRGHGRGRGGTAVPRAPRRSPE
jgi:hypothetical protein